MANAFNQKTSVTGGLFLNVLIHFGNSSSFICSSREFINISNVILLDSCKTHICIMPAE